MDLTQFLVNTQSERAQIRTEAEEQLKKFQEANYPVYLASLVNELANESKPQIARQVAGLVLKQQLFAKNVDTMRALAAQWFTLGDNLKMDIRNQVLATLSSPDRDTRRISALVLSTIANIDLPNDQWGDLVPTLTKNVTDGTNPFAMESSLMALGYICEGSRCPQLAAHTDAILNAVAAGMNPDNYDIKVAAGNALFNCLEFTARNFERESERTYIMKLAYDACQSPSPELRRIGLQCLVKIAYLYYHTLGQYIKYIFDTTTLLARDTNEQVALQAVEFWITIAEVESSILDEEELLVDGEEPTKKCFNFIQFALVPLANLLTELLTRQDEFQSDDDNNISNAAGTCLSSIAHVVGDRIVDVVLPFIHANLNNPDWHFKEAATLAFSAILDGPRSNRMNDLVNKAIGPLLAHVEDESPLVKDTTIFTLGRIAKFQPTKLIDNHLKNVLVAFVNAMKDQDTRVASKACWGVHNISQSIDEDQNIHSMSNALSPYYEVICRNLMDCSKRPDISEGNLRLNCFEAIGSLIHACPQDQYQFLYEVIVPELLNRLLSSITPNPTEETVLIQGLLCGTLQGCTEKLRDKISRYSDEMVKAYLTLFKTSPQVFDDVLMAFGSLIDALEGSFLRYIDHFMPFLFMGLAKYSEDQVFYTSVNVVGALCSSLFEKMRTYSDEIMKALLIGLEHANDSVKPNIINCFGDIALAIEGAFETYIPYVSQALISASKYQCNPNDEAKIDYQNTLRENILEAYSGILQGLKVDKPQAFNVLIEPVFAFLRTLSEDRTVDRIVFKAAVTLIGDLANVYGKKLKNYLNEGYIYSMIADAKDCDDQELKKQGLFASENLQRINS